MKINSCSLAAVSLGCVFLATPAWATTLYTNGPINGTQTGWDISSEATSDSFTLSGLATILSVTFGEWVTSAGGPTPETVDWEIGSSAFGSDLGTATGVSLTSSLLGPATPGYNVFASTFTLDLILAPGAYWLTLLNATTSSAATAYWDQNSGPSLALFGGGAPVPSESFTIAGTVPEPSTFVLLLFGLCLMAYRSSRT